MARPVPERFSRPRDLPLPSSCRGPRYTASHAEPGPRRRPPTSYSGRGPGLRPKPKLDRKRYLTHSTARETQPTPTCHYQDPPGGPRCTAFPRGPTTRIRPLVGDSPPRCTPGRWHELRRSCPLEHATPAAPDQTTSQETQIRFPGPRHNPGQPTPRETRQRAHTTDPAQSQSSQPGPVNPRPATPGTRKQQASPSLDSERPTRSIQGHMLRIFHGNNLNTRATENNYEETPQPNSRSAIEFASKPLGFAQEPSTSLNFQDARATSEPDINLLQIFEFSKPCLSSFSFYLLCPLLPV